jgi:hypothetical protein
MKRLILVGLLTVAVSSYSSVFACDHSHKNVRTTMSGSNTKIIGRTSSWTQPPDGRLDRSACKIDKARGHDLSEFEVPSKDATHFVSRLERERRLSVPSQFGSR